MTPKQESFIRSLASERVLDSDTSARLKRMLADPSTPPSQASATIDWLLKQPKSETAAKTSTSFPDVPAGRYAVDEEGVLRFFKVDRPEDGRWAGFTFLNVQASEDFWPVKDRARKSAVLAAIAVDPKSASARYGHELGVCGVCGRTLTDEESRERGIGPVCWERF